MISPLRSTAFRLGLGQATASLLGLALLALALWWTTASRLNRDLNAVVREDTRTITGLVQSSGTKVALDVIENRVGSGLDEDEILLLADASFVRLGGNLPAWPLDAPLDGKWGTISIARGGEFRQARVLITALPTGEHLLAGQDLHARNTLKEQFRAGVAAAALMVIITAIAGAWMFRRRFVERIEQIDTMTQAIIAGQLQQRLPVNDERNELDLLAGTINRMLDQIEQLISGIRNVSNAIAHDLRTPLGELHTRLESLLMQEDVTGSTATEVEGAIADTDRLITTFNALLRLAELDSGARRSGFVSVDIAAVIDQAVDIYQPVAETRSVMLTSRIPEEISILGDPVLLAQSIANLIDNALKFAPSGSAVVVTAGALPLGQIALAVTDQGPGIPAAERSRVVERFVRGSGSKGTSGVGLGLSLVAAIVRLHGGELRLEDNEPGLVARIILPQMTASIRQAGSLLNRKSAYDA